MLRHNRYTPQTVARIVNLFVRRYSGQCVVLIIFLTSWYALAYGLDNNFSPASGTPMIIPPPHRLFEDIHGVIRTKILVAF